MFFLRELLEREKTVTAHQVNLMYSLRSRRKQLKMTQTDLAGMSGSSQKQISCYERQEQIPSVMKLLSLAKALKLEIVIRKKENKEVLYQICDYLEDIEEKTSDIHTA